MIVNCSSSKFQLEEIFRGTLNYYNVIKRNFWGYMSLKNVYNLWKVWLISWKVQSKLYRIFQKSSIRMIQVIWYIKLQKLIYSSKNGKITSKMERLVHTLKDWFKKWKVWIHPEIKRLHFHMTASKVALQDSGPKTNSAVEWTQTMPKFWLEHILILGVIQNWQTTW